MKIVVNGAEKIIEQAKLSLADLLVSEKVQMPETVSVQRNGEFVDRKLFASTMVKENDEIDFLYFMGGGAGR